MTDEHDPLWNPAHEGDEELRRYEALLAPFGAKARGLQLKPAAPAKPVRRARWLRTTAAIGVAASVLLATGLAWTLSWREGNPWAVSSGDSAKPLVIARGEQLQTGDGESAEIAVARIGRIALSPDSSLRLLETRAGRHRVQLDHGHLRARIWAPPGWFGISSGDAEVIDLGCDFDIWKQANGHGRVFVRSGWVAYEVAEQEVLVPAGFAMRFDAARPYTPMRPQASAVFARAVQAMDRVLIESGPDSAAALQASATVAAASDDADGYSLLSLLTRYPVLAKGELYPRLAASLKAGKLDDAHRAAWLVGDQETIDSWWQLLPRHPKSWWRNWKDWF